jgi:NADPH-dependent 7-cyano-7-deazaguanine reductase QueF
MKKSKNDIDISSTSPNHLRTKIYQQMTPEQKLHQALLLYHSARELKAAALRTKHPDWTEDQVQTEVREIFLYACVRL